MRLIEVGNFADDGTSLPLDYDPVAIAAYWSKKPGAVLQRIIQVRLGVRVWVDGFAIGVVRMLIGFARIHSVCESVRIANPSRRRGSGYPLVLN